MKITHISLGVVTFGIVGALLYSQIIKPQLENRTVTTVAPTFIENIDLSFAFTYPSGEAGYSLIEPPLPPAVADGLKKVYILMNTEEYIYFQNVTDGTETPPTVSVFVVELPVPLDEEVDRLTQLRNWAELSPQYTSFRLRTAEPEITEIDGVGVLHYSTDGLYQQEVYLASHKGNAYVFVGQFDSDSDDIHDMYKQLMNTVAFY